MSQELNFFDKNSSLCVSNLRSKEDMTTDQLILLFMIGFATGISVAIVVKGKLNIARNEKMRRLFYSLKKAYIKRKMLNDKHL